MSKEQFIDYINDGGLINYAGYLGLKGTIINDYDGVYVSLYEDDELAPIKFISIEDMINNCLIVNEDKLKALA